MKTASMTSMSASRATRRAGLLNHIVILFAGLACLAFAPRAVAQSGTIALIGAGDPSGQSVFNSASNTSGAYWEDNQAPHADAHYIVGPGNVGIRTPQSATGELVFLGDSLTLQGRGSLAIKMIRTPVGANTDTSTIYPRIVFNDLRMDGTVAGYNPTVVINQGYWDRNGAILAGKITLVSGTATFDVAGASAASPIFLTIESNITGSGALLLRNSSGAIGQVITLSGSNNYTGATGIDTGAAITLGSDNAFGNTSGVIFTDTFNSTIDLNGHNASLGALSGTWAASRITNRLAGTMVTATVTVASGTTTYDGIINNAPGAVAFAKAGAGTFVLTGVGNTWSGPTDINGGTLLVHGNAGSNATATVTVAGGGALGGTGTIAGIVTVQNGGALLGSAGSVFTLNNSLTLDAGANLTVALGAPSASALFQVNGNLVLDGHLNITDASGFGAGLYRIINYTGLLTDNGLEIGSLPPTGNDALMSIDTSSSGQVSLLYGAADYWRNGDGVWNATNNNWSDIASTITSAWSGNFGVFLGAPGTVTVDGGAGAVSFTGMQFATDGFLVTGASLATSATLATIRVGDGTAPGATISATIASVLTGAGGIEKTDLGTLVLAGGNTYAGQTIVRNGTLLINGDQTAATGALTVRAGAVLGGTGTAGGGVTIGNGGALSGAQGSLFTMKSLTLGDSANLNVALGAPAATGALFRVEGDLVLDGRLNITDAGGFDAGLYRIIDYTGSLTDRGIEIGTVPVFGIEPLLTIDTSTAHQVDLIYGTADFWNGGNGTWNANAANTSWADTGGSPLAWTGNYAIFRGTPGTVTVDNNNGPVLFNGGQFAVDGYLVNGGALTISAPNTTLRVGDGTPAGGVFTATIAATITGAGSIEKTDYGTLALAGANSYAGATVVKGGALLINGDQSAATGALDVRRGATLGGAGTTGGVVTVADDAILAGRSGQTLTMGGLVLNASSIIGAALGAPSATTLFQVNGDLALDGILNITDAGSLGPGLYRLFNYTGALTDNGLEFGALPSSGAESLLTIDTSVAGRVSLLYGTAGYWAGGSGMWDTTTANWLDAGGAGTPRAWGGSFAIFDTAPGIVTINSGAGPDAVVFNGAQFAVNGYVLDGNVITASVAPSIIRVGDGTGDGAAIAAVIAAEISGSGGIDKTDLGTLVLSGNNSYTGDTRIKGGTLRLASTGTDGFTGIASAGSISATEIWPGARLEGNGTVRGNLVNNGGIAPGFVTSATLPPEAIRITGNYTQTAEGTLAMTVGVASGRIADPSDPSGTATIPVYSNRASIMLVNGAVTLDGDLVVTNLPSAGVVPEPGRTYPIIVAAGSVTGTFANMDAPWGRLSQMVLFEVLYGARDVSLSFTQLPFSDLNGNEIQHAIAGAIDGAIALGTIRGLQAALNSLQTEGEVLAALAALSPQIYERYFTQALHSVDAGVRSIENRLASPAINKTKWNLWTELILRDATIAGDVNIRSANTRSYGAQAGVDRAFGANLKAGLFLSITDDGLDDRLEATRHLAGLYARATLGNAFADIIAGGGTETLDATRDASFPGYAGMTGYPAMPKASMDASEYFASARLGYALALGKTRLTPYAALQYMRWKAGAFDERTAWDTQLRVADMEGKSLATRLGFDLAWTFGRKTRYTPRLSLAWRREFEDDARDISASIGGSPFTVRTQKPETDGIIAGLGFDAALTARLTAYLALAYERTTALKSALDANVGLAWKF
jgi:autotransporter-associated beta strand protein